MIVPSTNDDPAAAIHDRRTEVAWNILAFKGFRQTCSALHESAIAPAAPR